MTNLRVIDAEPPGAEVIESLRHALEMAEKGELSSIAIALVYRDGSTGSIWSRPASTCLLLGSITRLSQRLARTLDQ